MCKGGGGGGQKRYVFKPISVWSFAVMFYRNLWRFGI